MITVPCVASSSLFASTSQTPSSRRNGGGVAGREVGERRRARNGRIGGATWLPVDDDGEASETVTSRLFEQLHPAACIARDHRRGAPREGSGNRPLGPRLGFERRNRECLAGRSKRACCGRDPLALRDRALERLQPLAGRSGTLGHIVALGGSGPRSCSRVVGTRLELCRRKAPTPLDRTRFGKFTGQALTEPCDRLAPKSQALPRRAEGDETPVRALLATGRSGERSLDGAPLAAHLRQLRLGDSRQASFEGGDPRVGDACALSGLPVRLGSVARSGGRDPRGGLELLHGPIAAVRSGPLGLC